MLFPSQKLFLNWVQWICHKTGIWWERLRTNLSIFPPVNNILQFFYLKIKIYDKLLQRRLCKSRDGSKGPWARETQSLCIYRHKCCTTMNLWTPFSDTELWQLTDLRLFIIRLHARARVTCRQLPTRWPVQTRRLFVEVSRARRCLRTVRQRHLWSVRWTMKRVQLFVQIRPFGARKWFNQVESRLNLKSAPLCSDLVSTTSVAGSWNYVASAAQKLVAGGGRKRIGTFSLFRLSIRKSHFPIKLRKAAAWKQLKHSAADSSLKC